MGSRAAVAILLCACVPAGAGQDPLLPDLGPATKAVDGVAGQAVPPVLDAVYGAAGQNLTREDVRIHVDVNFTKGDVNLLGLLVGSGRAEVQAKVRATLEMRVVSVDRIRALVEGENAFNASAANATFLAEAYLPADAFRATLTAEAAAAFQRAEEAALARYLARTVPEMDVLALEIAWRNVSVLQVVGDTDLAEPPITVEVGLVVQYTRVESLRSLLSAYIAGREDETGRDAYVDRLKAENGDPLHARDFFSAAAYTQLMNLSMQPGWSLDVAMAVPRGYSFTYTNGEVERRDERHIALRVDALGEDQGAQEVFLASITHKRAVALALFGAVWAVGLTVAFPFRFLYRRRRLAAPPGAEPEA